MSNNNIENVGGEWSPPFEAVEEQTLAAASGGRGWGRVAQRIRNWWQNGGRRAVGNGTVQGGTSIAVDEAGRRAAGRE